MGDFIAITLLILFILLVLTVIFFGVKYIAIGIFLAVKYSTIGLWKAVVWLFEVSSEAISDRRLNRDRTPTQAYRVPQEPYEIPNTPIQRQGAVQGEGPRRIIARRPIHERKDNEGKTVLNWDGLHNEPARRAE